MQAELDAMGLPVPVHILGVNGIGHEGGNASICSGRDLPWLQDVPAQDVWTDWQVTYRDVILLDEQNEVIGIYNLSMHDLQQQASYDELKMMLVAAAGG